MANYVGLWAVKSVENKVSDIETLIEESNKRNYHVNRLEIEAECYEFALLTLKNNIAWYNKSFDNVVYALVEK